MSVDGIRGAEVPPSEHGAPLAAGSRIGSYEIQSLIGTGGMGEVYLALDLKLGRQVALKILPAAYVASPDWRSRMTREARALASVNHPNIAAIYGLEESGDTTALVLELVPGLSLAERIAAGPLPVDEALAVAKQIADALDAAHEQGIVHRDLKPANVRVRDDGVVKVLDFGLAKTAPETQRDLNDSPTVALSRTEDGVTVGTAPYMSPEQARARAVDKRTDIWAFGCVLYEMLTGTPAFRRDTFTDTLAAIVHIEPDFTRLPRDTPRAVVRLLRRCLEKDVRLRLRDIGDARADLDVRDEAVVIRGSRRRALLPALAGAAVLATAVAGTWWFARSGSADQTGVQMLRVTDMVGLEEAPAISPDGKTVAFVSVVDGKRQILVRLLSGGTPLQLTHDAADHLQPRWTPDASALVYFTPADPPATSGAIWEIPALGGAPRRLANAIAGADVSHDGRAMVLVRFDGKHSQIAIVERGNNATSRVLHDTATGFIASPRWSPDDSSIAFQLNSLTDFDEQLLVVPAAGGPAREVAHADFINGLSWLPDGSGLVFSSSAGSTVLYPPLFNLRIVNASGAGERALTFGDASYVDPDLDARGRIAASRLRVQSDIWRFPVTSTPLENARAGVRVTHQTGQAQTPSIGADPTEIVYLSDSGGHGNLWIAKTDGSATRQLTYERDPAVSIGVPVWSPASNRIAYIVSRQGRSALWTTNSDGTDQREIVHGTYAAWSPDGRWLYYTSSERTLCLEKMSIDDHRIVSVRCDEAAAAPAPGASAFYYATTVASEVPAWGDMEIRTAWPDTGPARTLARISAARMPLGPFVFHMFLSPDGKTLAMPLTDGVTTNLWALPTDGGSMHPLTDFGSRPTLIARRVSWAPDGRSIFAALAEIDADVVLFDGLAPRRH